MWKDLRFRVRALLFRRRVEKELDEELQFHLEMQAHKNRRREPDAAEAARQARLRFGSMARAMEECRDQRGISSIEIFAKDVRFAYRTLRKSPAFTLVAVATLALGIGANAVVFGVMNALILRPVDVPRAESLYGIERGNAKAVDQSYPDYRDLRDHNHSFEDLIAYDFVSVGVNTGNNSSSAWIQEVTGNYFDALGVRPFLGRFFHGSEERGPDSAPYIVLTYAYWQSHFQGDRSVVGRVVRLNKYPFTILGVAPRDFRGTLSFVFPEFWVPIVNQPQVEGVNLLEARGNRGLLMVLGHLKPGVTRSQAVADLDSIGAWLEKSYPKDDSHMTFSITHPWLAGDWLSGPLTAFLTGLMLLAGLILLAACTNLGSLFAARAADRSREVALRLALGAGPMRILRQLFTEAVLVSLVGGAIGLWGSVLLLDKLSVWHPFPTAPLQIAVSPDARVYGVALLLTLVSAFFFGAVPVRQVLRTDPYQVIKSGPAAPATRRIAIRDLMLVVQIAICALLVTASLVALRGLARSLHSRFGFDPQHAIVLETSLNMAGYSDDRLPVMQKRMIDAVKAIPGVDSAGTVDRLPLYYGANSSLIFSGDTNDLRPANAAAVAMMYKVSPGYFQAARTTLLAGRTFSWHDDRHSPRVAVINRTFARKVFGSPEKALNRDYKLPDGSRVEVVGIAENGKYVSLAEDPQPAMFLSALQFPSSAMCLVVRAKDDPRALMASVNDTVRRLDRDLPFTVETWKQELESALFPSRVATLALGVLGAIGAILSITGIFGMAAYSVSKRLRELGIRVALGARRREVLEAALGRALKLLAWGSAAGLILGILASRVLASIVYAASPRDPLVLAGVVLAMLLMGLVATWIPAERALSIDPGSLLRHE
jgi:predicted permease